MRLRRQFHCARDGADAGMMDRQQYRAPVARRVAAISLAGIAAIVLALVLTSVPVGSPQGSQRVATHAPLHSEPADGAALSTAPTTVELVFPASVRADMSHVAVLAGGGADVASGELTQPAPGTLRRAVAVRGSGDFTVVYHVVHLDGTQSGAMLRFSVGTGVPPAPLDPATAARARDAAVPHGHSVDPASAVVLVVDAVAVVVVAALLLRRRRPVL